MGKETALRPIVDIHAENGSFSYGSATATIVDQEQIEKNRNLRTMVRRAKEVSNALDLPFSISETPSAISHDNGNAYAKADFGNESFYLMVRTPLDGRAIQDVVGNKQPELHIVSGPCLFSTNSTAAISRNGEEFLITKPGVVVDEPTERIVIQDALSLYEAEAIVRLSSFIGAMGSGETPVASVRTNIPRVEYYNYVLGAYEQGHFTPGQLDEWFNAVDHRNERLQKLFQRNITRRTPAENPPKFVVSEPLKPTEGYIKTMIQQGKIPDITHAKELLSKTSDMWDKVFATEDPENWLELNTLSYVVAELETARIKSDDPNRVAIGVVIENPTEAKIFGHARKTHEKLVKDDTYNLIGLFPHELVIPTGESARKIMYHIEEPDEKGSQHARVIFQTYKKSTI